MRIGGKIINLTGKLFEAILNQKIARDDKYPKCPYAFLSLKRHKAITCISVALYII